MVHLPINTSKFVVVVRVVTVVKIIRIQIPQTLGTRLLLNIIVPSVSIKIN